MYKLILSDDIYFDDIIYTDGRKTLPSRLGAYVYVSKEHNTAVLIKLVTIGGTGDIKVTFDRKNYTRCLDEIEGIHPMLKTKLREYLEDIELI